MLTELSVKNFALIENLRLSLKSGFTAVSGETGAGKSLLVTAIGLLRGGKADSFLVRQGAGEAVIEAVFELPPGHPVWEVLSALDLSAEDPLIIRRLISAEGRSRITINDATVTLGLLEAATRLFIDLAGQHSQQVLLDPQNHLTILDEAAGRLSLPEAAAVLKARGEFEKAFVPYNEARVELETRRRHLASGRERLDFLRFQAEEISKAALKDPEEEDKLLAEKARIKHADALSRLVSRVDEASAPGGALLWLENTFAQTEREVHLDPALAEGAQLLREAVIPFREASRFFSSYGENLSVDPARLDQIESRLFQLSKLRRKYGENLASVMAHFDAIRQELKNLEGGEEGLSELEKKVAALGEVAFKKATALSKARAALARVIEKAVVGKLKDLAMGGACFEIRPKSIREMAEMSANGIDDLAFYLAANKGEPTLPLETCASGGELSRVLLAIKTVLGAGVFPMTCLFDEIDAGIGGAAADAVGSELARMAKFHQVLVVTHLPQIASWAHHHFVIEKGVDGARTKTSLRALVETGERETEVARMLGGMAESQKAKAHARELLEKSRHSKGAVS